MAPTQDPRISALAALARAISRSSPLLKVLEIAAEESLSALAAASVSVSQFDHEARNERTLVNVGKLGPTEERWPTDEIYQFDDFENLNRQGDCSPWVIDVRDPDADPREVALLNELEKGAAISAPLMVDDDFWGEIYATRLVNDRPYVDDDVAYVEALAAIVSGAISRARREDTLEQLAFHDPLTGLLNRRALDDRAAAIFAVDPGADLPVAVVVVDINGLKLVNDSLGHAAGDELIKAVARRLERQFAQFPSALLARVGGDEFTALVAGHELSEVVAAAQGLYEVRWDAIPRADVSCGAACVVVTGDGAVTPADLFASADRAQYVAKHGRLHTVVVADRRDAESDQHLEGARANSGGDR